MSQLKAKNTLAGHLLQAEKGSTLLAAMIVVAIVSMSYLFVLSINASAEKQIYKVRFRNQLNAFENRWRSLLTQPSTYADSSSGGMSCKYDLSTDTLTSCAINPAILAANQRLSMMGAGCDSTSKSRDQAMQCGFFATVTLDQVSHSARLQIDAIGTSMKPVDAIVSIPKDVLQQNQTSCPAMTNGTRPRFMGLRADGTPNCAALVKPSCSDTQYAAGVDATTGAVQCADFPNFKIGCGPDSYLTSYTWDQAGPQTSQGCGLRPEPSRLFASIGTAATPVPTGPTPNPTATPDCLYMTGPNGTRFSYDATTNTYPGVPLCGASLCAGYTVVDNCGTVTAPNAASNPCSGQGGNNCGSSGNPASAHNSNPSGGMGAGGSQGNGAGGNGGAGGGL